MFVPYPGCSALVPYTNPDGTPNPLGGSCVEELSGYPTSGGQITLYSPGRGHIPMGGAPAGAGPGYTSMPNMPPIGATTIASNTPGFWPSGANGPMTDPLSSPGGPINPPNVGTTLTDAGMSQCSRISNVLARAACEMAVRAAGGVLGTLGGGSSSSSSSSSQACPSGYRWDGSRCVTTGVGAYLPGDVGAPDTGWTAVNGWYGVGRSPLPVQRIVRACPSGWVLGKDGVCYESLPRTKRAHNPGARPLLTGGDMNALRKAASLQKKITKINRRFGKKVAPRAAAPRRKR